MNLRAEAEGEADWAAPALDLDVSVRHPGAPRLLAALGFPGLEPVIDTGSFALLAHLMATPRHVTAENLSITAATFRIDGRGQADLSGPVPVITGALHAGSLALPAMDLRSDTPLPTGLTDFGNVQIDLKADEISAGLRPVLKEFGATFAVAPGRISLSNLRATLAGGTVEAEARWEEGASPPRLTLRGTLHGASPICCPFQMVSPSGAGRST